MLGTDTNSKFNRIFRQFVTVVVVLGFLAVVMPIRIHARGEVVTSHTKVPAKLLAAPVIELKLRSESQIKIEAGWYDTALQEVSRVATLNVKQPDGLKAVHDILNTQVPKLRYNRSKLASIGLAEATFISAVRARAKDKTTAEQFALELANDPSSILRISGGQALADRLRRSIEADVGKLRQIAAQLQQASVELKQNTKIHHSSAKYYSALNLKSATPAGWPQDLSAAVIPIVVAVAVIVVPPLALALHLIANAIAGVTVIAIGVYVTGVYLAAAVTLIENLISNLGSDEGKDKIAECQRQVDAKYLTCVNVADQLGILSAAARLACYSNWLLASGACLFA